jgi:hypothetical protein
MTNYDIYFGSPEKMAGFFYNSDCIICPINNMSDFCDDISLCTQNLEKWLNEKVEEEQQ